jgi:DNA repair protein RadC
MAGDLRGVRIDPFSPELRRYLIASMGSLADETLRVLFLDNSRRLIADESLQHGTLSQLSIFPRTIFRRALEHNAAGLILVHNHPSGDPSPSEEDITATRRLDQIGRSLDIEIVDHIIVTSAYTHHIISRDAIAGNSPPPSTVTLRAPNSSSPGADRGLALANAEALVRRRLLRQQLIGAPELFGDAAWEMLVDLFIHECRGKDLSISSLCLAVSIPMSSALRLAQKLCDAGILRRIPDPIDGRRSIMKLEPAILHRLRAYFEAGSD